MHRPVPALAPRRGGLLRRRRGRGADQGRLVASEPSPDAAVDAKQQLEQLCGAFGGLSDSHHEILVLREFEGLSYREIGDRMGLSRPGVESTLFRARKRLGEEYDELVSGQRCVRIQSIIASAESSAMGARDTRRLARHIAHCQPCRRQAVASGIDAAVMARKPARRRVIDRVAGLLPIPAFLRGRGWHGGEQIVPVSEPMAAAWSKAVAVAATVIVAGVGAGVAPQRGDSDDKVPDLRDKAKPAAVVKGSGATPAPARVRPLGAATPREADSKRRATIGSNGRSRATVRSGAKGGQPRSTPRSSTPAGSGPGSTAPTRKAAVNPSTSAPKPSQGVTAPSTPAGATPSTPSAPRLPKVDVPPIQLPAGTNQVGGPVGKTVEQTTQAVNQTVDQVEGVVNGVTGGLPPLGG